MRIKRAQVIKALRTEPLQAGNFFHTESQGNASVKELRECKVCAVGAVLRSTGIVFQLGETEALDRVCIVAATPGSYYAEDGSDLTLRQEINALIKNRLFLDALSVYFEGMAERGRIRRHRLVEFVKRYFPSTIRI